MPLSTAAGKPSERPGQYIDMGIMDLLKSGSKGASNRQSCRQEPLPDGTPQLKANAQHSPVLPCFIKLLLPLSPRNRPWQEMEFCDFRISFELLKGDASKSPTADEFVIAPAARIPPGQNPDLPDHPSAESYPPDAGPTPGK
jgi:hypothetical protein